MSQGKQHEAGASEGARRATGEASALSALVGTGRWSARRKVSVVIEWLKGESLEGLSRRHGVTAATLSQWRGEVLAGGEARLKHRETPIEDEDTRRLKSVVADLATDKALLVERFGIWRPAALWAGGGRSDASRDVALHPAAVRDRPRHPRMAGAALHGVCPARSTGSPLARGEARAEDAVDRCGVDRPHPDDHRRESVSW